METIQSKTLTRQEAASICRKLLDEQLLNKWHVRLSTDAEAKFLGLCVYADECIILNAHLIDTIPEEETIRVIRHEVAHALTPGHNHDEVWRKKAIELGCDNTSACAEYALSKEAINAIRSGATLEVSFEETKVKRVIEESVRIPKFEVKKLEDRCHVCNKVIRTSEVKEFISQGKRWKKYTYECGHFYVVEAESQTLFETFITAEHRNNGCNHQWNKNTCESCGAFRPFPFQIDGMRAIERSNGRHGIFDEMGLGKTIQSLGWIYFHPEALPVLYIVKSGIKYQWMSQIFNWLGDKYLPQVLNTSKENFLKGFKSYVVSYDILRRLSAQQLDGLIENIGIKTIVLDECQQIKNPDSSRTSLVRKLVKQVPYVIPLSGTPWKNRGSEFFVALNMLDARRFWNYEAFKRTWVNYYWDGKMEKEGGIVNPEKFKAYVKDIITRRERIEVMPELPTISRNKLIVEVPEDMRKIYNMQKKQLIDDYNKYVLEGQERSFEAVRKMNQSLMIMKQTIGIAKIPGTVEFAQEFLEETDRQLAIGVHHKECGIRIFESMSKWCAENNIPQPLKITADMNGAERFEVQQKFTSKQYRLIILSTLASGEGLNLQTCSDLVVHERQWNPANEEQLEGRFARIGQMANAINATYVHGEDTIDIDLDAIVEGKRREFHRSMNKSAMPVWNESSIQSQLIEKLVKSK